MAERYDYESLGADAFHQLCQALLVAHNPNVQCFPVGMPDGGRDASAPRGRVADAIVYQVKFRKPTPNKLANPDEIANWVISALEGEIEKVQELASKGAEQYVLLTNAQCSSHPDSGTRDRVQAWLSEKMPIPAQVWWRDDLDRRLDPETEIKRTYGFIREITGLAELLGLRDPGADDKTLIKIARGDQRVSALMKCMAHQYERDRVVKFKQAELEPQLLDVFIDVPLAASAIERPFYPGSAFTRFADSRLVSSSHSAVEEKWAGLLSGDITTAFMTSNRTSGRPAASVLLSESMVGDDAPSSSRIVLEGAPGQGKSTVGQYVCQAHRARLLGNNSQINRFSAEHRSSPIRLPFHVDFRDLAAWLRRRDPFDITNDGAPEGWSDTLEAFLAAQVRRYSGGLRFSVSDLDAVLRATPAILVLDGLDEVPDLNDRRAVVSCVNEALNRIEPFSPSFRTMASSRPSSFSKTPGFSKREWTYFGLGDLPLTLVLEYTDGWLMSRRVTHQAAYEIRQVLGQKLGQPHIVDLARNPMQLAILLWLVRKKGPSLPDKRTALYREYMETFLDREAEKSSIIRDERELILDLHGYVAWELHCLAETGDSNGSIAEPKLKALLKKYLQLRGYKKKKLELVDQLFTGMTDRVMVLTSRVQNTFEFEVQPLREYFAARYLYSTARTSSPGAERSGNRSERFEALLRNPYWWNVTRFYAGFSDVGELANIVDLLEDLIKSNGDYSLISYSREVALTLLRDQVFSQKPRSVSRVVDLVSSEESVALLGSITRGLGSSVLSLPFDSGGEEIVERMRTRIEKGVASGLLDFDAARLLAENSESALIVDWWYDKWSHARNKRARRLWFFVGKSMDLFHTLSPSQGEEVFESIGNDTNLWHSILQPDVRLPPSVGETNFDSFLAAFRAGVQLNGTLDAPQQSAPALCTEIASLNSLSYLMHVSDGLLPRGRRRLLPFYNIREELEDEGKHSALLRRLVEAASIVQSSTNTKNKYSLWVDFHEALTDAIGGKCQRTLAMAAFLGEVRGGNISRKVAGGLFDESISPVLRARYARQRRLDRGWWADQLKDIESSDDAFFALCCILRWAPPSVLMENEKRLDKWIRGFDAYTLYIIHSMASNAWIRPGTEPDPQWLTRSTAGMLYLASTQMDKNTSITTLNRIAKSCRDQDLKALISAARLAILLRSPNKEWADSLDDFSDSFASCQPTTPIHPMRYNFARTGGIDISTCREILRHSHELPPVLRHMANEILTAEVAAKATTLANASTRQEWFDQETLD
ncbi:NACHT domain-containing protein [Saccharopolyspora phatthalungensis]|uniref:NACHT domain-containing protein n=1 Tax=Saccharopolyspora phatthalungensis TaxID=664693 RepID=A0A840QFS6_9PSEU|nr:hypothetical protein [Saccharopolyspora phatthalungensis]MBB5157588.1 hypothetical protein [Saccharopolyspora phatthalungensis]